MAPPPIKINKSTTAKSLSSSTTCTIQDAHLLVREALRISANLASTPPPPLPNRSNSAAHQQYPAAVVPAPSRMGMVEDEFVQSSLRLICCEEIDGDRWKYVSDNDGFGRFKKNSIRAVRLHAPQAPVEFIALLFPLSSCLLSRSNFPLNAVEVAHKQAIPGAVAINLIGREEHENDGNDRIHDRDPLPALPYRHCKDIVDTVAAK